MRRLIAIAGSPRRDGNTEIMLDAFLSGVTETDVTWEKLRVTDMGIEACRSCGGCLRSKPPGRCVIRDRMRDVIDTLRTADAYALATPIWFGGPPAQLKAVIDRCQSLWAEDAAAPIRPKLRKVGVLLVVGGMNLTWQDPGMRSVARSFFAALHARLVDEIIVHKVDDRGEINEHPEILEQARRLGCSTAERILAGDGDM